MLSRGKDLVEFVHEGGELVSEEVVGGAETAAFGEWRVFEVVGLDLEARACLQRTFGH